jgi:glycosyltransferase involved in cell wall biosynthesis
MPEHVPLSIVVPVRNEAARIAEFVQAHRWADEIIVVDNGSEDDTAAIAAAAGARVVSCPEGTIADARNAGADAARWPWILALDADERAEPALAEELAQLLPTPRADAYFIRRRHLYRGREQRHGSLRSDEVLRFYRRSMRFTARKVHEVLHASGLIGTLKSSLLHDPYRDRAHHLEKIERYARWGAEDMLARRRRSTAWDRTVRPLWRLWRSFVMWGGFRDGAEGWELARLEAHAVRRKYQILKELQQERRSATS